MTVFDLRLTIVIVVTALTHCQGIAAPKCQTTCSTQNDIDCRTRRIPYPCLLVYQEAVDHPNKPENFTYSKHLVNNTYVINLSWRLPKGYSYHAVKGFQLEVNKQGSVHQCYHFNLSTVNWRSVDNIQGVVFEHCLQFTASRSLNLWLSLYSLPKANSQVEKAELKIKLPAKPPEIQWSPNISTEAVYENLTLTVDPWYSGATYLKACLHQNQLCVRQTYLKNNKTVSDFINVPCNKTYTVWLRPYLQRSPDTEPRFLTPWIETGHSVFMPCVVSSPLPPQLSVDESSNQSLVPKILIACLLICLLAVCIVFLWCHRTVVHQFFGGLCKAASGYSPDTQINNHCEGQLFPVFYPESAVYESLVTAHLHLLRDKYGISVQEYHQDVLATELRQDIQDLVIESLKNKVVIIYYSDTVAAIARGDQVDVQNESLAGQVCRFAMDRLNTIHMSGQAVVPINVTFYTDQATCDWRVADMIRLVKEECNRLSVVNFDSLVYKLPHGESQDFSPPIAAETRDLHAKLYEFYEQEQEEDCVDSEHQPMIPQHFDLDTGSIDTCLGSVVRDTSSHDNRQYQINREPIPVFVDGRKKNSLSSGYNSGYNSGSTDPRSSGGEWTGISECNMIHDVHGCVNCGMLPETTRLMCGGGDQTTPMGSAYTLDMDHIPPANLKNRDPNKLSFFAPEIQASDTSLHAIEQQIESINHTSGF